MDKGAVDPPGQRTSSTLNTSKITSDDHDLIGTASKCYTLVELSGKVQKSLQNSGRHASTCLGKGTIIRKMVNNVVFFTSSRKQL